MGVKVQYKTCLWPLEQVVTFLTDATFATVCVPYIAQSEIVGQCVFRLNTPPPIFDVCSVDVPLAACGSTQQEAAVDGHGAAGV